jgi:methylthioribulose-1-phosphate dehydratase
VSTGRPPAFPAAADAIAAVGRRFYARGWVLGTSGNLSAVVSDAPLRLAITPSGAHKGLLSAADVLEIDRRGRVHGSAARPSAETALHLELVESRGARAVLHTHSVWATILSARHHPARGLAITGHEMLKGLQGVTSHEHREWIPILGNDQDMARLRRALRAALRRCPAAHAVLLAGHGLYTWGTTLEEAERHVEILEFLFEVVGRATGGTTWPS